MKRHVLVRANARPIVLVSCAFYTLVGICLLSALAFAPLTLSLLWRIGLGMIWVLAFAMTLYLVVSRPRVALDGSEVLVFLDRSGCYRLPQSAVEACFLGESSAHLPPDAWQELKTQNLVFRIARKAKDWQEQEVDPRYGHWSDGYIVLRGTTCEPLSNELIRRVNKALADQKRKGTGYGGNA